MKLLSSLIIFLTALVIGFTTARSVVFILGRESTWRVAMVKPAREIHVTTLGSLTRMSALLDKTLE